MEEGWEVVAFSGRAGAASRSTGGDRPDAEVAAVEFVSRRRPYPGPGRNSRVSDLFADLEVNPLRLGGGGVADGRRNAGRWSGSPRRR